MNTSKKEEHAITGSPSPVRQKKAKHRRKNQEHQHKPTMEQPVAAPENAKLVHITENEIQVKWSEEEEAEHVEAQRSEACVELGPLQGEVERLHDLMQKSQQQYQALEKRMATIEEHASERAKALQRQHGESEEQRFYFESSIRGLEKRLAILEEKKPLLQKQELKAGAPPALQSELPAQRLSSAILLEAPQAAAVQDKKTGAALQTTLAPPLFGQMPELRKLEIFTANANSSRWANAGQSFGLRLLLDGDGKTKVDTAPWDYQAVVYAKSLNDNSYEIVAEAQGHMMPARAIALEMMARSLPSGTYRLHAKVTLAKIDAGHLPYTTALDGGLMFAI